MMIPAPVLRQFIMIESHFALGQFKINFDTPALTTCPGHFRKGDSLRSIGKVKLDFFLCHPQSSPDHQPRNRTRFSVPLFDHPQTGKLKLPWSLISLTETNALP